MTKKTKIILNGCMGRLGIAISALKHTNCEIIVGVDTANVVTNKNFPIYTTLNECTAAADVVLDCSSYKAVPAVLEYCIKRKLALVICTTGLTNENYTAIKAAAQKIAILQSANMALGINLLMSILQKSANLLYNSHFDIEILEKHHNQKKDAPSGTAIALADAINKGLPQRLDYITDRSPRHEKRTNAEIGIHAIRGGTITGEHSVIFAGYNEVIEFNHQALSREVFATGALKAAQFIAKKEKGLFSMQDVIHDAAKI
ncbi:MAG: 4-hydroxy-tetrahydrodipicolinate reductase [Defluviitaleaceae bacterium]|nr:4-hydroxy-tetrahydrodipicolinate reductase [Defluviitaleaceae bacterium]